MNNHKLYLRTLFIVAIIIGIYIYFTKNFTGLRSSILAFVFLSAPVLLWLSFLDYKFFSVWSKFSLAWLFFSIYIIAITPEYGGNSFFPGPDRSTIGWLMAALFLLVSLVLIARKSWKLKNKVS